MTGRPFGTWGPTPAQPTAQTVESGSRERKRRRHRSSWRTFGTRTCPVCGSEFEATVYNARFCPPTDEDRAKALGPNTQVRSWCSKAFENATRRGTLDQLLERVRENAGRLEAYDCAQCGKRCEPGINVPPHASKFCCRDHKRRWHREASRAV